MPPSLPLEVSCSNTRMRCGYLLPSFLKKLRPAQTRYIAFSRELLAMYLATKHFRYFLEGRSFHILTDHKPITFAMQSHQERHSPREARHLEYVSQFTTDIRHIHGVDNHTADALSRIEINASSSLSPVDYEGMAEAQESEDISLHDNTSLQLQSLQLPNISRSLVCDTSTGSPRPLVPPAFRKQVFHSMHDLAHPGISATQKLVASRFVWPNMQRDLKTWTRACLSCQRNKVCCPELSTSLTYCEFLYCGFLFIVQPLSLKEITIYFCTENVFSCGAYFKFSFIVPHRRPANTVGLFYSIANYTNLQWRYSQVYNFYYSLIFYLFVMSVVSRLHYARPQFIFFLLFYISYSPFSTGS